MKSLTKENFFNRLQVLYPEPMKHFCEWVDDYKKEVNWERMFSSTFIIGSADGGNGSRISTARHPKFHDIPFELQFGILMRYAHEYIKDSDPEARFFNIEDVMGLFEDLLKDKQEKEVES